MSTLIAEGSRNNSVLIVRNLPANGAYNSLSALEPAMQYGPRTSPFAWRENGYVFILDVREDASGLHQLLRALFRSRTLV